MCDAEAKGRKTYCGRLARNSLSYLRAARPQITGEPPADTIGSALRRDRDRHGFGLTQRRIRIVCRRESHRIGSHLICGGCPTKGSGQGANRTGRREGCSLRHVRRHERNRLPRIRISRGNLKAQGLSDLPGLRCRNGHGRRDVCPHHGQADFLNGLCLKVIFDRHGNFEISAGGGL